MALSRAGALVLAAALALPGRAHAQNAPIPPARLSWVSCRVIAPATLQLIWSSVPGGIHAQIELTSAAGPGIAMDTTADTTFTKAALPAGLIRILVTPMVRGSRPLSATAELPLRVGSARCGGT
jgi:hypothetical protein